VQHIVLGYCGFSTTTRKKEIDLFVVMWSDRRKHSVTHLNLLVPRLHPY
jgi:hypothetical protein